MLGTNVVETMYEAGFEVVTIVRRSNIVLDTYSTVIKGNVADFETLKSCALGCDAIVHVAAATDPSFLKLSDYSFNWTVAQNVGIIANELKIGKVIFISSANTIGNGTVEKDACEDEPLAKPYLDSLYGKSKVIAETKLKQLCPNAIILNPTFMIGKYDSKPSSGYVIQMGYRKKIVFVPHGGKNFVPAIDVAKAVCSALHRDVSGNFILSGYEMTFKEFMKILAEVSGYKTRVVVLPKFAMTIVGYIGDFMRLCKIQVSFSSANSGILNEREYYSNQKAQQLLDYKNTPLNIAIKEASQWMLENGKLKK